MYTTNFKYGLNNNILHQLRTGSVADAISI